MTLPLFNWLKPKMREAPEAKPFKHLRPGGRYHVVKPFFDYDCVGHPAGESWIFDGSNFLPYDDGLSLFVTRDNGRCQHIRLQWRPEAQGAVIDALEQYLAARMPARNLVTLRLTRDSVAAGDDADAPHAADMEFDRGAAALEIAEAILAGNYTAHVAGGATWWLSVGGDRVVFGFAEGRPFFIPVAPERHRIRAADVEAIHVSYALQAEPNALAVRLGSGGQ
jgi:hypothetical protein